MNERERIRAAAGKRSWAIRVPGVLIRSDDEGNMSATFDRNTENGRRIEEIYRKLEGDEEREPSALFRCPVCGGWIREDPERLQYRCTKCGWCNEIY